MPPRRSASSTTCSTSVTSSSSTSSSPYVADHAAGRTPNPCIECNRHLKFDVLLRRAELLGFDAVATGHHARVVTRADGTRRIARGADPAKDQSYVLYPLTSLELETCAPADRGDDQGPGPGVEAAGARAAHRGQARQPGRVLHHPMPTAAGRSSSGGSSSTPVAVVDEAGAEVGSTDAVELVTIGQRRGLDLAGGAGASLRDRRRCGRPRPVTVGPPERLQRDDVDARSRWCGRRSPGRRARCSPSARRTASRTRRRFVERRRCDRARCAGTRPSHASRPGQSVVLYQGDRWSAAASPLS